MPKPQQGQALELAITTLAFGGQGIGRSDEFVVFVPGALPGDVVRASVLRTRRRYAEARLEEIILASPDRVNPRCDHHDRCGGCGWEALDYPVQLRYKQEHVEDALRRLGGLRDFDIRPIRGMEHPWGYRNKVEFSIGHEKRRVVIGFHPPGRWDQVVATKDCHLVPETTNAVRATVEEWLADSGVAPWDPRSQTGYARQLTVREAHATGEIIVNLVTTPGTLPGGDELVRVLQERHRKIVGILHTVAPATAGGPGVLSSETLQGRPYLFEELGGLRLKISMEAFFQTNTKMARVLYQTAAEEAGLSGTENIWDLYSGIGSIALSLAPQARALLGIEVSEAAVRDAETNARMNGVVAVLFIQGNVRVVLKEVLEGRRRLPAGLEHPDVVVVDPPRGGLSNKVIARIAGASPVRVVYVSCNVSTMASNAALFEELGYRLRRVAPVDMFPHTPHVEAVGLLERT